MISDLELAWLAGFADGEGTFVLPIHRKTGLINAYLSVSNTNVANIERAKWIVSGISGRQIRYTPTNVKQGWRPCYRLTVNNHHEIALVCRALLPWVVGKREHAEVMLRYIALVTGGDCDPQCRRKHRSKMTDEHYGLVAQLRHLNRRYAKGEWASSQREIERLAPTLGEETTRPLG